MENYPTIETSRNVRKNILEIEIAIKESIDKVCKENNHDLTYLEINSALINVLKSNFGYELREATASKAISEDFEGL